MDLNIVLAVICGAVALVGAFCVVFQIYHMTVIDATARGLKHPKFWGVFTMSGNNSSGYDNARSTYEEEYQTLLTTTVPEAVGNFRDYINQCMEKIIEIDEQLAGN